MGSTRRTVSRRDEPSGIWAYHSEWCHDTTTKTDALIDWYLTAPSARNWLCRAFKGYVAVFKMRRLKMFRVVIKQNQTILQSAVLVGKPFNTKNFLSQ